MDIVDMTMSRSNLNPMEVAKPSLGETQTGVRVFLWSAGKVTVCTSNVHCTFLSSLKLFMVQAVPRLTETAPTKVR